MTSTERVHAALTGTMPDRVPLVEMLVDPKVAAALVPGASDMAEAMDLLGLDCVPASAAFPPVTTEGDYYVDEWGVTYKRSEHVLSHPLKPALRGPDDLLTWTPPDPDAPHRLEALRRNVARYKGQRAIFFHHRAAFMHSVYLLGMDRLLEAFYTEPEFVHDLMDRVVTVNERVIRNAIRAGAEVICIADDYASNFAPMFSPAHFREFVLPRLKEAWEPYNKAGLPICLHSCGNITDFIPDLLEIGMRVLEPVQPVMDLAYLKRQFGRHLTFWGGIETQNLLPFGTPQQVKEMARRTIRTLGKGGRHIIAPSQEVMNDVPIDNVKALVETIIEERQTVLG